MKNTKAAYLVKDRVLDRADEIERKMNEGFGFYFLSKYKVMKIINESYARMLQRNRYTVFSEDISRFEFGYYQYFMLFVIV
jgi:hypothetical protein